MQPLQIVPSTTSHKKEPIATTLEIFARLGFRNLDLNLNHIVEGGANVEHVRRSITDNGQHVEIVSGGWCNFFDDEPHIERTFSSVAHQVGLARYFGVRALRLFFGRLARGSDSPAMRARAADNIRRLADSYSDMDFWFENHDGASSLPDLCLEVLERVDRRNARLVFDPINFEHRGVPCRSALDALRRFVSHVHLKGYDEGDFCGFGEGSVDLTPVLCALLESGYRGGFTVEYEGRFDRTLRLYESVRRAENALDRLSHLLDRPR